MKPQGLIQPCRQTCCVRKLNCCFQSVCSQMPPAWKGQKNTSWKTSHCSHCPLLTDSVKLLKYCHSPPRKQHQTSCPHRPQKLLWDFPHIINSQNNRLYSYSLPPTWRLRERELLHGLGKKRGCLKQTIKKASLIFPPLSYTQLKKSSLLPLPLPQHQEISLCYVFCVHQQHQVLNQTSMHCQVKGIFFFFESSSSSDFSHIQFQSPSLVSWTYFENIHPCALLQNVTVCNYLVVISGLQNMPEVFHTQKSIFFKQNEKFCK